MSDDDMIKKYLENNKITKCKTIYYQKKDKKVKNKTLIHK